MKATSLILNEDSCHFFITRTGEDMDVRGLHALVDRYAHTQVSQIVFNVNCMRTSYRSMVWDAVWDNDDPLQQIGMDAVARQWIENARLLYEKNIDPYEVWINRCRVKSISPYLSMRMNDVHSTEDPNHWLHSSFWREHPEWRRVPSSTTGGFDQELDYARPEVREYHFNLIKELLERYDPDGIELDWMRWPYHFKPGHERRGASYLNQFMIQVREHCKMWSSKRGRPIRISARVPATPEAAQGLGLDGVVWAREGLIDTLVPAPFHTTANFDIPIERWRTLIGDHVELAAGLTTALKAYPEGPAARNEIESVRGFASSVLDRGADHVYLFNYMDSGTTLGGNPDDYPHMLRQCGQLQSLQGRQRRHILTFNDTTPPGVPVAAALPSRVTGPHPVQFRIHTGPAPATDQEVVACIGLKDRINDTGNFLIARINGSDCRMVSNGEQVDPLPGAAHVVRFSVPPFLIEHGYNLVEILLKNPEALPQEIVWLELRIDLSAQIRSPYLPTHGERS